MFSLYQNEMFIDKVIIYYLMNPTLHDHIHDNIKTQISINQV